MNQNFTVLFVCFKTLKIMIEAKRYGVFEDERSVKQKRIHDRKTDITEPCYSLPRRASRMRR